MKKNIFSHLLSTIVVSFFGATTVFAQNFEPLAAIPGLTDENLTIVGYLERIFFLAIIAGALFAVVRISIAGFKYMMTDVITSKSDAREDIKGAFIGLGILLATVIVLTVINPNLLQLDFLKGARELEQLSLDDSKSDLADLVNLPPTREFLDREKAENHAESLVCPAGHKPSVNGATKDEESTWDSFWATVKNVTGSRYVVECKNTVEDKDFPIYDLQKDGKLPKTDEEWQKLIDAAADRASEYFNYCNGLSGYRAILTIPRFPKNQGSKYAVECKFMGKK